MRFNERLAFCAILVSAIIIFSFACGGESGNGGSGGNGGAELGASEVIGLAGGAVEVVNPSSPLYGIKVEVPPDALNTDSTISIETATSSPSYNTGSKASSAIFKLESTNASYFNIPVTVTVPYDESLVDDESYIGLFIYNPSTDSWQSTTTTYEIDTINNTISAATMHFSIFQIISLLSGSIEVDVDTGFSPYLNGFNITNTEGWCFGMSAYSKWFFVNKKPNTLYGFYPYSVARLVAEEAHLEITAFGGPALGLLIDLTRVSFLPYCKLHTALVTTGEPTSSWNGRFLFHIVFPCCSRIQNSRRRSLYL